MKLRLLTSLAAVALSVAAFPQTASAQADWITARPITVALTLSYTAPSLQAKDESGKVIPVVDGGGPTNYNEYLVETYNKDEELTKSVSTVEQGGKVVTRKRGNVEVLKQLLENGELPGIGDRDPSIAGWSLVIIADGEGLDEGVYARHTSKLMVPLDGLSFGLDEEALAFASTYSIKSVTTTTYNPDTGDENTKETFTSTGIYKALGIGSYPGIEEPLRGLFTYSPSKTVVKTETIDGDKFSTSVAVPGAGKLDKILGSTLLDEVEETVIVEGSLASGPGAVVDRLVYFGDF